MLCTFNWKQKSSAARSMALLWIFSHLNVVYLALSNYNTEFVS